MPAKKKTPATPDKIAQVTIRRKPLAALGLHERNPRIHPEPGTAKWAVMEASLKHDYFDPLVWNKRNEKLVSGHFRKKVLSFMGYTHADVVEVDYDEHTHIARMIAANKAAGDDNLPLQKELFAELADLGDFDFTLTNFATGELPVFSSQQEEPPDSTDAPPQLDRAKELLKKWKVKPGEIWAIGEHRLMCGDCTDKDAVTRVHGGRKAQMCVTSPPYAEQRTYDKASGYKAITADKYVEWWQGVDDAMTANLMPTGWMFLNIGAASVDLQRELYVEELIVNLVRKNKWIYKDVYCWLKTSTMPMSAKNAGKFKGQWEPIYALARSKRPSFYPEAVMFESGTAILTTGTDGSLANLQGTGRGATDSCEIGQGKSLPGNVLKGLNHSETVGHPAVFPLGLPEFFIKAHTVQGDLVYDPFNGSGTTMVAAQNHGRKFCGMEMSPAYCAVTLERMATAFPGLTIKCVSRGKKA